MTVYGNDISNTFIKLLHGKIYLQQYEPLKHFTYANKSWVTVTLIAYKVIPVSVVSEMFIIYNVFVLWKYY